MLCAGRILRQISIALFLDIGSRQVRNRIIMAERSDIVLADHIDVMLLGAADRRQLLYEPEQLSTNVRPRMEDTSNYFSRELKTGLDLRTKHISHP